MFGLIGLFNKTDLLAPLKSFPKFSTQGEQYLLRGLHVLMTHGNIRKLPPVHQVFGKDELINCFKGTSGGVLG